MLSLKLLRGSENAEGVRVETPVPPDAARFVIGRDPSCDWPIPDKQLALSARHCEIVRIEGRQVLRDTSTNGTFLNGARERLPADHVLRHGDRITLGSYLIEVSVVQDAAGSAAKPAAAAGPAAPRRGGDPAAMVGADWERAGASARSGGVPADVKTGLTRISKPPPKQAGGEPPVMVAPPRTQSGVAAVMDSGVPPREPVRRAPPGTTDVLQRLAGGLGVPAQVLGNDPAVAAERVARLLRMAVLALHRQLAVQTRQLQELRSASVDALSRSEAGRLRTATGPEEAVSALLAAGDEAEGVLVRAHKELGQHAQRLLAAFSAAGVRLADQLAPSTLERSAEADDDPARLWKIYSSVWTALGIGAGKGWADAYGEAASAYLAAAYDDPQLAEKAGPGDKAAR